MGTFHNDKGELHGITVYAQAGNTVYVGRCDVLDEERLVLHDADVHVEGPDGLGEDERTNEQYLQRAARFGVWKTHDLLVLPAAELGAVRPLGELVRAGAAKAVEATAPAPAAPSAGLAPATGDATTDEVVALTPGAAAEVRRLLAAEPEPGRGLRLGVAGGGCSGLTYKVEFDRRRDGDVVVAHGGFEVYMDRKSAIYLRGITVDHQPGLTGRGFQFRNPNATNTCGCGESFAI
jgi:iron-sulfur cluster assembly protein